MHEDTFTRDVKADQTMTQRLLSQVFFRSTPVDVGVPRASEIGILQRESPMPNHVVDTPPPPHRDADVQRYTIAVAVLTFKRPDLLERFLSEFERTESPPNTRTVLLVVDNDEAASAGPVVNRFQNRIPEILYVVEAKSGIPPARNRAIEEALAIEADALCFIDDDEYPDQLWLTKLFDTWRQSPAKLVGGPVRVAPSSAELGRWKNLINRSLAARQQLKNRAAAVRSANGNQPTIVTNNWLCDLHWLKDVGIRFDEQLLVTGGSDTAFFRAAVARGCATAWCPEAVVYETIEPARLSLRYQLWRGKSQSMTHFHMKHRQVTPSVAIMTCLISTIRFILGCLLFVLPVHGIASLVKSVRSLGWSVGRIQALLGWRSRLYDYKLDRQTHASENEDVLDGPSMPTLPLVRRLFRETKGHRIAFCVAVVAMICVAISTAGLAWLMRSVVNDVFVHRNMEAMWFVGGAIITLSLIKGVADYTQSLNMNRISNSISASLKRQMFEKVLRARIDFFTSVHSSRLIARFNNGAGAATAALKVITTGLARNFLTLVSLVTVMVIQNPILSLAALVIGPAIAVPLQQIVRRLRKLINSELDGIEAGISVVQETCQGIRTVKSFNLEPTMEARLGQAVEEIESRSNAIAKIGNLTSPLMEMLGGVTIAAMVMYTGWQSIHHGTPPGEFMAFLTAFLLAYEPAKRLANDRVNLSRYLNRTRKMYQLLDAEVDEDVRDRSISVRDAAGSIRVSRLSFGYGHHKVLHDVTLDIQAGEVVALVGPSGAGKSTLFSLLQRFYEPWCGTISIDGVDIADLDPGNVRQLISVVSQDTTLFSGTIGDNIQLGRLDATQEEIEAAAVSAAAYQFISKLPLGFNTQLGERHATLSGGQAQRLAIARAVLKNAPILLLDEATSALDTETERDVQEAVAKLMRGRTTVVIAHRRSTIEHADRICVLQDGRVVESGRHDELIDNSELYRRLFGEAVQHSAKSVSSTKG